MADQDAIERLDVLVDAILSGRSISPVVDAGLATLAAVAMDLRELPRPDFKLQLRRQLMPAAAIKEGFRTITPYLVVKDADELIAFLRDAFGAELAGRYTRPDGTVMHAELNVSESKLELGEANDQYPAETMALHLYVDNADAVYERALASGATPLRPMTDQFYGDREGVVIDPAGNHWYIATHQATGSKPPGYATITPFIHVRGIDRLIDYVKSTFDAVELSRFAPEGLVFHAALRIGDSIVEMGEAPGEWKPKVAHIHLMVPDADAVFARALENGATVLYPVADMPYGERSGGVTDPFGNQWFIATPSR